MQIKKLIKDGLFTMFSIDIKIEAVENIVKRYAFSFELRNEEVEDIVADVNLYLLEHRYSVPTVIRLKWLKAVYFHHFLNFKKNNKEIPFSYYEIKNANRMQIINNLLQSS
jgi:hypothetical protein